MAVFGAARENGYGGGHRGGAAGERDLSILAAGMRIAGTLETDGFLRIEGTVEGDLRAKGQVLVSPGGSIEGDLHTRQAIVAGEVRGQIFATESVELKAGCKVDGDITTPRIKVEEGGVVNGELRMSTVKPSVAVESGKSSNDAPPAEEYGRLRSVG
jgi:cytoskeletal protein CcmA (bactofilin family)